LIESGSAGDWSIISAPAISGSVVQLSSVSCTSATACVAVGFAESSSSVETPLAEAWDGTSWSVQSVPLPSGYGSGFLDGVSCTSAGCEAVGLTEPSASNQATVPLVATWDGSSWTDGSAPSSGMVSGLNGVWCSPGTLDCTAVGFSRSDAATVTLAEAGANGAMTIESTPNTTNTGDTNELDAIDCSAANACTAVGVANNLSQTLVERWDGASWSIESSPNPTIGVYTEFLGVACPGVSSCLAVGGGPAGGLIGTTLAESWDGAAWSINATPDTESLSTDLAGVSCASASDCVAVGSFTDLTSDQQSFAELWDGSSWTASEPPSGAIASTELSGVSCPASSSCVAVGTTALSTPNSMPFAATWNGASWVGSSPLLPSGADAASLDAVSCLSMSDCVAVGYTTNGATSAPLVEQFNGAAWSVEPDPPPAGEDAQLSGVSCVTATDCVAVGEEDEMAAGTQIALAQEDTGSGWSTEPALGPLESSLNAVDCIATDFCYAAGQNAGNVSLLELWDGITWTPIPAQNPGDAEDFMGVSCANANSCAAVGESDTGSSVSVTLAEQWNGTTWTTAPTPTVAGIPSTMTGVSCPTSTTCFSVGYSGATYSSNHTPIVQQYLAPPDTTPPPSNTTPPPSNTAPAPAPQNTALPKISGTTRVGQRLSVSTGSWTGSQPIQFHYQWQRCHPTCQNIAGATTTSYLVGTKDVGQTLRVVVAAVNSAGTVDAASPERGPILPAAPTKTVTARMAWAFRVHKRYAAVTRLSVLGASVRATVTVLCTGQGCPFARESRLAAPKIRCHTTKHRRCAKPPATVNVSLAKPFRHSHLAFGARVTVKITRPGYTGKVYIFTIAHSIKPSVTA
jgi:hypothetical protein